MHTDSNPKHSNAAWFEELCALACIGELSSSEFDLLQHHLLECADCSRVYADFGRLSAQDLGLVAIQKRAEAANEEIRSVDEDALLARLIARTERGHLATDCPPALVGVRPATSWHRMGLLRVLAFLRRPALNYLAIASLVCTTVGVGAYRLKDRQLSPILASLRSQVKDWKNRVRISAAEKEESASEMAKQRRTEQEAARKALREAEMRYAELQSRLQILESRLATAQKQADQKERELEAWRASTVEKSRQLADLDARLQDTVQRLDEQSVITDRLRNKLGSADRSAKVAMAEQGSLRDGEVASLFGARDLHIVDVYDVDSKGKTKRTYGRVYYVEKELLIFYAFDLEHKERNRAPAGFQAWGYSQPNEGKPENLGLFTVDDASMDRWVLEVKNPRVLQHIDAVFVTLESPEGSSSPRGRRLLYANLATPANHP
ncbi:MAG: hypothetical protein ACRD23_03880 [Terriglobales bacterium]